MDKHEDGSLPSYRPVKTLPFELAQHCGIYFEEKLYTHALSLLSNIIASGSVAWGPTFVPLPPHLSLATTLLVHPITTTRAKTTEEKEAPSAALRFLRLTSTYISPLSANYNAAFSFTHFESPSYGSRQHVSEEEQESELREYESRPINLDLAGSGSLWSRAEDFWHAVGWAFNCSIHHPGRWERWRLWLQFMCEVLEDDWNERSRHSDHGGGGDANASNGDNTRILKESLLLQYLSTENVGYGGIRRILRAIFADGSSTSLNEFRQVFKNELKTAKSENENPKKRGAQVNIDENEYGDYIPDRDEDESEGNTEFQREQDAPRRSKRSKRNTRSFGNANAEAVSETVDTTRSHGDVSDLGGFPSLALRQRILQLLSYVAYRLPETFIPLEELYHLFVENTRHLPLPIFQAFVSPYTLSHFLPAAQTTLCEYMLFGMREDRATDTDEEYLNQNKLETCFLPFAASTNSVIDNAKMSITLESLLMLLADSGMLSVTPELKQAVEKGIHARAAKAQVESRKNRKVESVAWSWLLESVERLTFIVNEALG